MQTFLPYQSFAGSAEALDVKRLGKQCTEVRQIAESLLGFSAGWQHHPVVRMWRGYERALIEYGLACCAEWKQRGYRERADEDWLQWYRRLLLREGVLERLPPWFGDRAFHAAHRAALLVKMPSWYGQYGWHVKPCIEYVWPV